MKEVNHGPCLSFAVFDVCKCVSASRYNQQDCHSSSRNHPKWHQSSSSFQMRRPWLPYSVGSPAETVRYARLPPCFTYASFRLQHEQYIADALSNNRRMPPPVGTLSYTAQKQRASPVLRGSYSHSCRKATKQQTAGLLVSYTQRSTLLDVYPGVISLRASLPRPLMR